MAKSTKRRVGDPNSPMMASTTSSATSEMRRGGAAELLRGVLIVAGSMIGLLFSVSMVLGYTLGVFISTLNSELGWPRADISICGATYAIAVALGSPIAGRFADRVEPAKLAAFSMIASGAALMILPFFTNSVTHLWLGYLLVSIVGIGTTPSVLLKPVMLSFKSRRGLALGIATSGFGLGAFIMPQFAVAMVQDFGWQGAYRALGLAVLIAAPFVWFGLSRHVADTQVTPGSISASGDTFAEAARTRPFRIMVVMALLGGFGMAGITAHLVPAIIDKGNSPEYAGEIAAIMGLASIAGRIGTGFALDRLRGPAAVSILFVCGAAGLLMLAYGGNALLIVAAILIGLQVGGAMDMFAYFVGRYFGLASAGLIFGCCFGTIAIGSSIGPYVVGILRDHDGSYLYGFMASAAAMLLAGLLCPLLGSFRYQTH